MGKTKSHHVVPHPGGGWDAKKGGSKRAIKHFDNKKEAVAYTRKISQNQKTELFIHGKDGSIQSRDSHGKDSRRSKG